MHRTFSRLVTVTLISAVALGAAGCASGSSNAAPIPEFVVQITDNNGEHNVPAPPNAVAVTDNRVFQTLADWGIEPIAAPLGLVPSTVQFVNQSSIIDLGMHTEPKLEELVVANPDVIINGQRFTQHQAKLAEYAPNAVLLNLDPRDGESLIDELKRQTTVLGEIFQKQAEAKRLTDDLDAALARVQDAYDPSETVLAITTSGGKIGYLAPGNGRTLGPVFDFAGLTPALRVDGASDNHKGDDINVEAIAAANPTWILVLDRDAALSDTTGYVPAKNLLANTPQLANVTAIREANVVLMPADTYTNEGIQTYTKFLNDFADQLESSK